MNFATPATTRNGGVSVIPATPVPSPLDQKMHPTASAEFDSSPPIRIFLFFHKAIRKELDELHRAAVDLATDKIGGGDMKQLKDKCHFLRSIYKHHCNAEDEVIFPALDIRVKNVARTYSLEHEGESVLFDHLFTLVDSDMKDEERDKREFASCVGALQTSISRHLSKEEEQVFPLLNLKYSFEEQASIVWQFLCSIPVNMMAEFLSWLSSSMLSHERQDMYKSMHRIIPDDELLQQIVFNWMDGVKISNKRKYCEDNPRHSRSSLSPTESGYCTFESSPTIERDLMLSVCNDTRPTLHHPVDDILLWHNAIEKELKDIAETAKNLKLTGEVSDLSAFNGRLQFIAEVCIFHSIGEDNIIFPAVDAEMSFVQEHAEERSELEKIRCLIERVESAGANSADLYCKLCSQADHIMETIKKHFRNEETQVLPLARKQFTAERQRVLLYQSLCVMPLRLIESVLPWLFRSLSEEEAGSFLFNMHMAAPESDTALVTLFTCWACKGCPKAVCLSSHRIGSCPAEEIKETRCSIDRYCVCAITSNESASFEQAHQYEKPVKQGKLISSVESNTCKFSEIETRKACLTNNSWRVPGLKRSALTTENSLCSSFFGPSGPLNSCRFNSEAGSSSCSNGLTARPIDSIFKFHKAIQKDLEFLDVESGRLNDCDEGFLRLFSGRFRLLWGLYRAHSNAEDDIVFPALESKGTLHNVSHSYTLDHKHEEELFQDMSSALAKISQLHDNLNVKDDAGNLNFAPLSCVGSLKKYNKLATKIQGMCKSLKVTLDHHIMSEEIELWPLFDQHFSVVEQDKIVGCVIGRTGAEVLQSMLPWVTSALDENEQNKMMDTWKYATKNTMFSEWLNEWWEANPAATSSLSTSKLVISQEYDEHESMDHNDYTFQPGSEDTFKINQNELELETRKASHDSTQSRAKEADDGEVLHECSPSFRDPDRQIFGCDHYKRNCKLLAACCGKLFTCRICHDDVSGHIMDRKATSEMMCMNCLEVQPVGPFCSTPACNGLLMAKYYCSSCKFFDDEQNVYHCPFCNLCRVGKGLGIDAFHCMTCNHCWGLNAVDHTCREKSLEINCPICCDFLFTSRATVTDLPCGHYMHSACFQEYACTNYICPICRKSMGDMSPYFGMLDALMATEELPEDYRNRCQDILCNDCDRKGTASFHWSYHKCGFCASYNTRVIKVEREPTCST